MEFVTTETEIEALLLEANLIKRLKPRFNVVLRDDKSFPFILICARPRGAADPEASRRPQPQRRLFRALRLGRRRRPHHQHACSAPFCCARARTPITRPATRPCLLYQIKRCSAPCTGEISEEAYGALVDEALRFLRGESDEVKHRLHALMDEASERQDYERAASFRDRLTALSHIQSRQGINPHTVKDADVFAAHQDAGQTCIQVFFFRTGNNWGNRAYFPRADKSPAGGGGARILHRPVLR